MTDFDSNAKPSGSRLENGFEIGWRKTGKPAENLLSPKIIFCGISPLCGVVLVFLLTDHLSKLGSFADALCNQW